MNNDGMASRNPVPNLFRLNPTSLTGETENRRLNLLFHPAGQTQFDFLSLLTFLNQHIDKTNGEECLFFPPLHG